MRGQLELICLGNLDVDADLTLALDRIRTPVPGAVLRVVSEVAEDRDADRLRPALTRDDDTLINAGVPTHLDDRLALASLPVAEDLRVFRFHPGRVRLGMEATCK